MEILSFDQQPDRTGISRLRSIGRSCPPPVLRCRRAQATSRFPMLGDGVWRGHIEFADHHTTSACQSEIDFNWYHARAEAGVALQQALCLQIQQSAGIDPFALSEAQMKPAMEVT